VLIFDYQNIGDFPLAPIVPVIVTPPLWSETQSEYITEAFLDTGSDCTLIPLEILSTLKLKVVATKVPITGVSGGNISGAACYGNLRLGEKEILAIKMYGFPGDKIQQRVLVGRDVMNQCCIEFDGINAKLTIR
jgi:Retroviral aspartyl protease